jgi:hypothetical protein
VIRLVEKAQIDILTAVNGRWFPNLTI